MTRRLVLALALVAYLAPDARAGIDPRQVRGTLTRVASGIPEPVAMAYPEDGTNRLFVVERQGRIRVIRNGVLLATPFLDIRSRVNTAGEGGMLGLAFRPDYRSTGWFFVTYTDANMTLHLTRFRASPAANTASAATAYDILTVPHPGHTNHNGGQVAFGPGGYLYLGTGDGGGSGDPNGNAQNLRVLLGKILRIDVYRTSTGLRYAIPPGNPYGSSTVNRREIWISGVRNPWRFSFDKATGELYIGDVGQNAIEEIDRTPKNVGGFNLGWDCREGSQATTFGGSYCAGASFTNPIYQYSHTYGCAIIGGHVYRGTRYASLLGGWYVFGDYCSGRLWALGRDSAGRVVNGQIGTFGGNILAFGRDPANELYLLGGNGSVYRIGATRR